MSAPVEMSGSARSPRPTDTRVLDESVGVLADGARTFARLGIERKIMLLREVLPRIAEVAEAWVRDGAKAKRIDPSSPLAGEEWLAGPNPTARNVRLLIRTLQSIRETGNAGPDDSAIRLRPDGRLEAKVYPTDPIDGMLVMGFSIHQLMERGLGLDELRARQASLYQTLNPEGGVSLILGAGNVSSIPPMDVLSKMFTEGHVSLLKLNPVNEWVGPHIEHVFEPLVRAGYLRIVYGGGDVGAYLVNKPDVSDVHITGSNHTHDLIVWGPPGPERDRRIAAKTPLLRKSITSELGNVSPVAIVPTEYSAAELDFLANNLVSMVTNNGSFNCNAGKIIIMSASWPQRRALLDRMGEIFAATPTRFAYYPGASDRYDKLVAGRDVRAYGARRDGHLPWTMIQEIDAQRADEPLFSTEPFCSLISETTLDATDPTEFLKKATDFMNDRLWGTLNATIVLPPRLEGSSEIQRALDDAIVGLRYGTVSINHWPAVVYGTVSPAWGGHPSATLENIQSGLGWVHNTYMLEGIEKTVLRGPFIVKPRPPWFVNHRKVDVLGRRLFNLELSPSWLKVPGIALAAIGG